MTWLSIHLAQLLLNVPPPCDTQSMNCVSHAIPNLDLFLGRYHDVVNKCLFWTRSWAWLKDSDAEKVTLVKS